MCGVVFAHSALINAGKSTRSSIPMSGTVKASLTRFRESASSVERLSGLFENAGLGRTFVVTTAKRSEPIFVVARARLGTWKRRASEDVLTANPDVRLR